MDRNKNSPGGQEPGPHATFVGWGLAYAAIRCPTMLAHGTFNMGLDCLCGDPQCDEPGAHAITKPTWNPGTIQREYGRHPRAKLMAHLGGAGLASIAINLFRAKERGLADLERQLGRFAGYVVAECGATIEYFFQAPPVGTRLPGLVRLAPGIVLAHGRNAVPVPPSPHPSGVRYEWRKGCSLWDASVPCLPHGILSMTPAPDAPVENSRRWYDGQGFAIQLRTPSNVPAQPAPSAI